MKDHSLTLKVIDQGKIQSLRDQMDDVGCIFEFVVVAPDSDAQIDEAMHRRALEQLMIGQLQWHRRLVQTLPAAEYAEPTMSWNQEKATATILTRTQVRNLTLIENYESDALTLYEHFRESRDPTVLHKDADRVRGLFREWLQIIGLEDREDVVVLNWIKEGNEERVDDISTFGTEPWSEYFGIGDVYRRGWCLTIWNPRLHLVGAIAACGAS